MLKKNYAEDTYRVVLSKNNEVISEMAFPATFYNQAVRLKLDIREYLPTFIYDLQSALSLKNENLEHFKNQKTSNQKKFKKFSKKYDNWGDFYNSQNKGFNKTPEKFIFTVYMNQGTVVEREFNVNFYNPETRISKELAYTMVDIVDTIKDHLYIQDNARIWEDYDLYNKFGFDFQKILSLTVEERKNYLDKIYKKAA